MSLVHSQETNVNTHIAPSYRSQSLHSCSAELAAAQTTYRAIDESEGTNRESKLLDCRSNAWFLRHSDTGEVRVASHHCRLRWCPLSSRSKTAFLRHEVESWFSTVKQPKFLTLTVKHRTEVLSNQLNHLYDSFRRFRKVKSLVQHCKGGVWFFQLCFNPKTNEWHPHLHCVIDSDYISHRQLTRAWQLVTADSTVVDIKVVRNPKDVASYVARYAARPSQLSTLPSKRCIELVTSMHGRRMCGSWGSARAISLRPHKLDDSDKWQRVGSWTVVVNTATFDERAKSILDAYRLNRPLLEDTYVSDYDFFIDSDGEYSCYDPKPPPDPWLPFE